MPAPAAVQLCKRCLLWKLLSLRSSHNFIWKLHATMHSTKQSLAAAGDPQGTCRVLSVTKPSAD